MYCTDFIFNNTLASSMGLMICSFNGGDDAVVNGGEVTFTVSKPPSNNKWSFHGYTYESQLTIQFSIGKTECDNFDDDYALSQDEQSTIMRWLQKYDGFHWLAFDQDGFEDVWYNVQINPVPHYISGVVAGYDITCTCDSPYGYSQEIEISKTIASEQYSPIFIDYSDKEGEIHPYTEIKAKGNGEMQVRFGVCNVDDNRDFTSYLYSKDVIVSNVTNNTILTFDEDYSLFTGINDINNFNFTFPFIGNNDESRYNIIENMSGYPIEIYMKYRMIRRVYV